ncbi:LAFE_0E14972g1_1 [Lachancea fermentati]|uniref:ubiquitinyl hydrolase 1 n=1 Tax=Lachancea fermentati TaxID=4955 RepID=A0A1G4MEB1_LACFM|nr:LAFE_0E14972g1_1 [Lachancea fermentati]
MVENTEIYETVGELIDLGKGIEDILPTMESQETLCEGAFTWHILDWNKLDMEKHVSPRFKIGEYEWDVLLFPQGNHNKGLSMYLEPHPEEIKNEETGEREAANPDWYVCAQFSIGISKPGEDEKFQLFNVSHHRFCSNDTDWGFANFIDLENLKHRTNSKLSGFLSQNKLNISVFVRILKDPTGVLWHNFYNYDSKKLTGYVGFKNQGATCYLNSLLQSYYFTKYFRRVVYQIPTDNESPNNSVSLALQRAFFLLQKSNEPLDTLELTRSFGWDTGDAFTQHDVQELNRILMDRLENKMKGTEVEGTLNDIFVGKMKSYIKCVNVEYESSRVEDFWDIQLNVKNLTGLEQSFQNYIEVEMMDGENQYAAQGYGLQDAKKGVVFESFPPVLHLQLKRFEYDFNYDQLVKINDRYEFPESIDLSPYLDPEIYRSNPMPCIYKLHCVLVHSGDISTGHYYAMIKPNVDDQWYRFDDDKVWKVTKRQVFDENFGHENLPDEKLRTFTREQYQNYLIARQTSAYMLVYIREDMEDKILEEVEDADVPQHIVSSIENEMRQKELRRRELEEMHLFTKINVHSMTNFVHYQGFDLSPNDRSKLFNAELHEENEYPISIKMLKSKTMRDIKERIALEFSLPNLDLVNFWIMSYRKNYTLRVDSILNSELDDLSLEDVMKRLEISRSPSIDIFLEESYLDLHFIQALVEKNHIEFMGLTEKLMKGIREKVSCGTLPSSLGYLKNSNDESRQILLFVKMFDSGKQRLEGYCHVVVTQTEKISSLIDTLKAVNSHEFEIKLFEEFQPDMIEKVDECNQFITSELVDGDILAFGSFSSAKNCDMPYYSSVPDYYEFLRNRIKLKLSRADNSEEEYAIAKTEDEVNEFQVWISSKSSFQELAKIISSHVNVDPFYIRVFAVYANGRFALKWDCRLEDYLVKNYTKDSIPPFEFEVLSIPLKELEHLRSIKFYWLNDSYIHYQSLEFRVSNSCSIGEFLDKLQKRIGFDDHQKQQVLLWTNSDFKFQGILSEDNTFDELAESFLFFGRVLPEELALVQQLERATPDIDDSMDEMEEDLSVVKDNHEIVGGKLVIVIQYFKELDNRHGISFLFNLLPGENFIQTRDRLHSKFGLGRKEFSKIKLGITVNSDSGLTFKPMHNYSEENLKEIILFDVMNNLDYICMDHPDRSRTQTYHDRPMVIKN